MNPKPKYLRSGPYIISLDYVHGVMACASENPDCEFQIFITYTDKSSVGIECPTKEVKDDLMDKISEILEANR